MEKHLTTMVPQSISLPNLKTVVKKKKLCLCWLECVYYEPQQNTALGAYKLASVLSSWPAAVTCVARQPGQLLVKRTFVFLRTHFKNKTWSAGTMLPGLNRLLRRSACSPTLQQKVRLSGTNVFTAAEGACCLFRRLDIGDFVVVWGFQLDWKREKRGEKRVLETQLGGAS